MSSLVLARIGLIAVVVGLVGLRVARSSRANRQTRLAERVLIGVAVANLAFIVFLWSNHLNFPLNLDLMEGTVLQHVQRAVRFEAIYPEPSPSYVPLAYNPLYYVLAVPFSWVFGVNLFTLRLVAVLGMVGSGLVLYRVVSSKTDSIWWGLIAVGLFAAAYRTMDAYMDTAHSDSWLVLTALLGTYLIALDRSRALNVAGVVVLVLAFWFKQHGALFVVGGVLYLTWRKGLKASWPYWLVATLVGPVMYVFVGPRLFGSHFHYFTWQVPRQWSELNLRTFVRYGGFIVKSYPVLAASGGLCVLWLGFRQRKQLDVWHTQFVAAALSGFMGTLDAGSSNNVYIPMGIWFILVGTLSLYRFSATVDLGRRYSVHLLGLAVTFAILLYDPSTVIASWQAQGSYTDLVTMLKDLEGDVYAPSLGQLQSDFVFYPAAHWVALEDMIRGPGRDTQNHPKIRQLLEPALYPDGEAYILANYPLGAYPWIAFLQEKYILDTDFGDRFKPLRVLPARWDHGWPRYLYRYAPQIAGGE